MVFEPRKTFSIVIGLTITEASIDEGRVYQQGNKEGDANGGGSGNETSHIPQPNFCMSEAETNSLPEVFPW